MDNLYNKESIRLIDAATIKYIVPTGYALMTSAAQSVLDVLLNRFKALPELVIFCGQGNNAGDGYVLARLALQKKIKVKVFSLVTKDKLTGDALKAYNDWSALGEVALNWSINEINNADIIIDAILGTGLNRKLDEKWNALIKLINQSPAKIIAIDIPSGLDANTGNTWGETIKADLSITFIAKKQGMYTAYARDYCGEIIFCNLNVPDSLYQQHIATATLLNWKKLQQKIKPRLASSHKGNFGNVLIIGGNKSMPGAVKLAAMAALRSGAGLVKILTHYEHTLAIQSNYPELIVIGLSATENNNLITDNTVDWADSIAIGPGLGTDEWAQILFNRVLAHKNICKKALVLDADALNLLALTDSNQNKEQLNLKNSIKNAHRNTIITPHPGEAARLLNTTIKAIENNRYEMAIELQQYLNSSVILKGAGTLVTNNNHILVCPYGNSGMSTAGMGDCLTGIIVSLLAQGYDTSIASQLAVCLHAKAADLAAKDGQSGMIASDILPLIRKLLA
ncbi:MAG: NAD(P)H-hydrate dehydratase [Pseudomonadota bacterium]